MIPKFDSWFKSWDHIFNEDSPANTSISLVLLGGYHLAMLATQRLSRGHLSYSEAAYTLKNDINYSTELSGLYKITGVLYQICIIMSYNRMHFLQSRGYFSYPEAAQRLFQLLRGCPEAILANQRLPRGYFSYSEAVQRLFQLIRGCLEAILATQRLPRGYFS